MIRRFRPILFLAVAAGVLFAQDADRPNPERQPDKRLENARIAVNDMFKSVDRGIPQDLIDKAQCVVVIPDLLKGAFLVGGQYGRGYAVCRHGNGWAGPAAVRMEGGSFGFQLGGQATDLIMLVMNRHGMNRLLGSKFTLGGEASAAAGPIGRQTSAETDATMRAEILTWSRSRGVFAGISLNGATLRPDHGENERLYGRKVSNREILDGELPTPRAGRAFVAEVSRASRGQIPVEARNHDERRRPAPDESTAPHRDHGARALVGEQPIQFATNETNVPDNAEPMLSKVAQTLRDNPGWKVRIEGFSDNRGNREANENVSRQRADAVMNWLADHGVDRTRMSAVGRGAARPVGDNGTDEGRAENRRVEIIRVDVINKSGL